MINNLDERRLTYISSGTSYMRIHSCVDDLDMMSKFNKMFGEVHKRTNHKYGLLYNAFTEPNFGKTFKHLSECYETHSDSGGLQLITQGKQITPALKEKIYLNQATYSDMAMCFDMIPISMSGTSSGRNDITNRFFDINLLESRARETGKNLARQIEVFQEQRSKAKPILIAQGNCYDTYMKWTEYILDEIPQDMHQHIGAVAMGGAALGTGTLEDIDRAFIFTQLPIKVNHIHVLGVGSVKRMLPYIQFIKNGMYDGVNVSYDSTTHSSGIELGSFFHNGSMLGFTRSYSQLYNIMWQQAVDLSGVDLEEKEFFKILNNGKTVYVDNGGSRELFHLIRLAVILASTINFCQTVDGILSSEQKFNAFISKNNKLMPLKSLIDVKCLKTYNEWMATAGKYVKTDRIASSVPSNLDGFF